MTPQHDTFAGQQNIWMLWLQGAEAAPELVRVCHQSWLKKNPGWRVNFLSQETVDDYLTEDFRREIFSLDLPPQKVANLIRLHLISRHGGVWADADCYCAQPLDDWLPQHMAGGFLAFRFHADAWLAKNRHRPLARLFGKSQDRILSNWFLVGLAGNWLSETFLRHHLALLKAGEFGRRRRLRGILRLATATLRRNAYLASKLSDPRLLRVVGKFPYFIFHYHFARLVLNDPAFDSAWQKVPKLTGRNMLRYSRSLHLPADDQFVDDFSGRGIAPVFKLHWKRSEGATVAGSRLRWLLDQRGANPQ